MDAAKVRRRVPAVPRAAQKRRYLPAIGVFLVLALASACDVLPGGGPIPETERTPQLASAKPLIAVSTPVTQPPGEAQGASRARPPQTVPGTGAFVRPSTSGSGGVIPTGDGDITFNFVNADVRDVLRELLGDQLHLQYAVDPKVQATVTAQTSGPIARNAVLPTLENILRASGVALLQAGGVYRVVPLEDANRASSATVAQPTTTQPGYGIRVLPLKFVKAAELKPLLDPFVPTGGVLETDNVRNLLIVSGPSGDLDGFAALVSQFDVDWLAGKSFAIYPLHAGKAKEVTTELQAVLEQGTDGSGPLAGLVRVVPVERLNAILVITSRPSYLSQMKAWVDRLDYGDANATPRFFEYQVQKTRAVDLARVLRQLFPSSDVRIVRPEKSPRPSFTRLGTPVALPGAAGTVSTGISGAAAAASVPAAAPAQQQTTDEDRDQPGGAPAGAAAGASELALPPVRIVADEKNNTLVIFARPGDYRMIEKMLQKLDVAPQQVLIEATIAELTLNDDLQYGVQYFLKSGNKQFELSNAKTGSLVASDLAGVFPGFNYVVANASQHAIINLLKSVTKVTVLSSPQLLVRNHQTAGLQVGAQVPIVTQSAQSVITANAPVINSIEYRNTGVILEVTPRINPDGMIGLEVDQEVSDVAPTTSSTIDSPTINDRHLVSSIMVQDGETIALGGLIREDTNDSKNGIPVLSDIPVVGPLFRTTDRSRGRTELLVLLSPKIVRDTNDARTMTEDLRNRIRGLRPLDVPVR